MEKELTGVGISYCATCDAPLFRNKTVAVVGSGNSALEAVIDLLPYAAHVYLLVRGAQLKGDATTQAEIKNSLKVTVFMNAVTKEITGEKFVKAITYTDKTVNEEKTIEVGGVFVEIGRIPNTAIAKGLVKLDEHDHIKVNVQTET